MIVDIDVEEDRGVLGRLADALVDDFRRQRLIVGAQARADLLELRLVEEVEAADEIILEQLVSDDEEARQGNCRRERVDRKSVV